MPKAQPKVTQKTSESESGEHNNHDNNNCDWLTTR